MKTPPSEKNLQSPFGSNSIHAYYTFDDLLLKPAYSDILPSETELHTQFSRNIRLNTPIVSAAMDTVTESSMAIAMSTFGGIGVIHRNNTAQEQAEQVRKVKRASSTVIDSPFTCRADDSLESLLTTTDKLGFKSLLVVDETQKLLGIITRRDREGQSVEGKKVRDMMTPADKLITINVNDDMNKASGMMTQHRIEKLPVVDDDFHLKGLITMRDIKQRSAFPFSAKDNEGRPMVAASIGATNSMPRAELLVNEGADALVIDSAHGHSANVINMVIALKSTFNDKVDIVAGNIATSQAAEALIEAGVDSLKVGIGPGSICTTRMVTGVGVPQLSALFDVVPVGKKYGVPVISDGGIRYSGDISKAMAAGADSVMLGNLLAGTDESPGELELFQGRRYKSYRGMGSLGAMQAKQGGDSAERYFQSNVSSDKLVPEGIEGRVPYRGSVSEQLTQMLGGVRQTMGYLGAKTIPELATKAEFVQITNAGVKESHVHDVDITRAAPNYHD